MKQQISEVLEKDVTRKEFLQYVGSALLIMFGVSNLIKMLHAQPKGTNVSAGYGDNSYGGSKKGMLQ